MQARSTFVVLTSGGLLGAAVAGAVLVTRQRRRPRPAGEESAGEPYWRICEVDILLDLARLA